MLMICFIDPGCRRIVVSDKPAGWAGGWGGVGCVGCGAVYSVNGRPEVIVNQPHTGYTGACADVTMYLIRQT